MSARNVNSFDTNSRAYFCSKLLCNLRHIILLFIFFFFQAEDGIRDVAVTGVQTCALPISCQPHLLPGPDREVGTEGILGGQAQVKGVAGTWKDLTDSVNFMASNLTSQVRSEERRVGKECRARWSADQYKKNVMDRVVRCLC